MVKSAQDILRGREGFGKRVVVAGSGLTGAESAVFLAMNGCEVYLMEMQPDIIPDAVSQTKACLKASLKKYGIQILTNTKLMEVGEGVVHANHFDEPITLTHIDTVVNPLGVRSYNPLEKELAELVASAVDIEDACVKLDIRFLPIIPKHIDRMRELPLIYRDPFDRIIIAQDLIEEMILITKDSIIPHYEEVITVW